jgi:hypothetical protein
MGSWCILGPNRFLIKIAERVVAMLAVTSFGGVLVNW